MTEYLINALILYVLFFILAVMNSQVVFWLHWALGNPRYEEYIDGATYNKTALLSFIGGFLVRKFNAFHLKTKGEKTNPYKALGVCIVCFGVHISNLLCIAYNLLFWAFTGYFSWILLLLSLLMIMPLSLVFIILTYQKIY